MSPVGLPAVCSGLAASGWHEPAEAATHLPEGQHNNNAESFSARQDRAEKGAYWNIEPKYLTDYAAETVFREDHRQTVAGAFADRALRQASRTSGPTQGRPRLDGLGGHPIR